MFTMRDESYRRTLSGLMLILTMAVMIFATALMVKVGFGLAALWEPRAAEAAPVATATPTPYPAAPTVEPPAPTVPAVVTPVPVTPVVVETPEVTPAPIKTVEPTPQPTPEPVEAGPHLIAGESGANVRKGPSTAFDKVGYLEPAAVVKVVGHAADWWQVEYEGELGWVFGQIATVAKVEDVAEVTPPSLSETMESEIPTPGPAPIWAIDEARWIDVDLSAQLLTAYEGMTPVKSYLVSTGLPATPTPEGQYRIWIKLRYDDMAGADYYIKDVPFVMYFHGGYGLHGVTWHGNFGHPMSHGCVNQPTDMAEWLFAFADVGTLVNIHE